MPLLRLGLGRPSLPRVAPFPTGRIAAFIGAILPFISGSMSWGLIAFSLGFVQLLAAPILHEARKYRRQFLVSTDSWCREQHRLLQGESQPEWEASYFVLAEAGV